MSQRVIVAGGGPVGLMLACELGLAGVDTVVLERRDRPNERSRGMVINATVVELLDQRGLMDPLRPHGLEFPQAHFAQLWLAPARLPDRHAYAFAIPHSRIEGELAGRARGLGVEIAYDAEIVALDQGAKDVTVKVRSGETYTGRYLVGCDGVDSTVRGLAGIGFPGDDLPFRGILGDVPVEDGDPLFTLLGAHENDGGLFAVGPVDPNTLRVMAGEFGVEAVPNDTPVTYEELRESFERLSGAKLTGGEAHWLSRWNAPTRQAERYRTGRVLLAGDAAHVHFPLGGQALSTGIEDAVNLGWKLAADVLGRAPDGLLDTYHDERHPVGARACLTTRAQVALLHPLSAVAPLRQVMTELLAYEAVNEHFVRMVGGLDIAYDLPYEGGHPLLGRRLPQAAVTTGSGEVPVARLMQTGRGLLLEFAADCARTAEAAGWAGRVESVTASATPEIEATALLLRPDGRIAWATSEPSGAGGLATALSTWFGDPAAG
nr:FAD dependent 4+2 cyclase [Micromonospora sp.]